MKSIILLIWLKLRNNITTTIIIDATRAWKPWYSDNYTHQQLLGQRNPFAIKRNSSRNTTTSNGGTPCASKNEYNDAKIKKYSTASASEQLICEETQREFNQ